MNQWEMSKRFVKVDYIRTGIVLRNKRTATDSPVIGIVLHGTQAMVTIRNHSGGQEDITREQAYRHYTPGIYA